MFRGGDYYDEPKFTNPSQIKNTMDISDIVGAKPRLNYQNKAQRDNMSVTDINGKPPLHQYNSGVGGMSYAQSDIRSQNGNGDQIIQNSQISRRIAQQDGQVAGVKLRPKSGERNMSEIFSSQSGTLPQKLDNRSLYTSDIQGTSKRTYHNIDMAAGVKNGSPTRKNQSSVFSHLPDNYDEDTLKRKDMNGIQKPRIVQNNLSGQKPANVGYTEQEYQQYLAQNYPEEKPQYEAKDLINTEQDELTKQFEEFYRLQAQMNQQQAEASRGGPYQAPPSQGYPKQGTNGNNYNILQHDIIDVKAKGNLQNNGTEIFNSGGYGSSQRASRRTISEQKFEQNFQKPMADRQGGNQSSEFKNYSYMKPAGGEYRADGTKISINQGKERLFGYADENQYGSGSVAGSDYKNQLNTGKKIINGSTPSSFNNIIGISAGPIDHNALIKQQRVVMMSHVPIPGSNYDMYQNYPQI